MSNNIGNKVLEVLVLKPIDKIPMAITPLGTPLLIIGSLLVATYLADTLMGYIAGPGDRTLKLPTDRKKYFLIVGIVLVLIGMPLKIKRDE